MQSEIKEGRGRKEGKMWLSFHPERRLQVNLSRKATGVLLLEYIFFCNCHHDHNLMQRMIM